jgi:hypothetical protein
MCNHCKSSGILSIEECGEDEEETCEYIPEGEDEDFTEEPESCCETARFIVMESFVEEHLCQSHAEQASTEEESTGYLSDYLGLGTVRIEPIEPDEPDESDEPESCEYFELLIPNAPECENTASHALILETETYLCPKHLREYQESDEDIY